MATLEDVEFPPGNPGDEDSLKSLLRGFVPGLLQAMIDDLDLSESEKGLGDALLVNLHEVPGTLSDHQIGGVAYVFADLMRQFAEGFRNDTEEPPVPKEVIAMVENLTAVFSYASAKAMQASISKPELAD